MIIAKIILDSIFTTRLTTFEVTYPRFILPQVNTHRVFSRNAASSRAIPTAKLIEQVRENPFVPKAFTVNKPGMSADQVLKGEEHELARAQWVAAARDVICRAQQLMNLGVHKQHVNRLIEPFMWVTQIISATEWDNFFELRTAKDVQPELQELADLMLAEMSRSTPRKLEQGAWHIPYIEEDEQALDLHSRLAISAARCARVSYRVGPTTKKTLEEDRNLTEKLIKSNHWSPLEHQAKAFCVDRESSMRFKNDGNFLGWRQYRHLVGEERNG